MFKDSVKKIGFSNFFSFCSVVISITSLVIVARISAEYTQNNVAKTIPKIVEKKSYEINIADSKNETKEEVKDYNKILSDIDLIIDNSDDITEPNQNIIIANDNQIESTIVEQSSQTKKISKSSSDENSPSSVIDRINFSNKELIPNIDMNKKIITPIQAPKSIKSNIGKTRKYDNSTINVTFENIDGNVRKSDNQKFLKHKVQLAVFQSHSEAIAGWFRIKKEHKGKLDKFRYSIEQIPGEDKNSILYRLYIECETNEKANQICNTLKGYNIDCLVTT